MDSYIPVFSLTNNSAANILVWTSLQTDPRMPYLKDKLLEVKLLERHHQLSFQEDIPVWTHKHHDYREPSSHTFFNPVHY